LIFIAVSWDDAREYAEVATMNSVLLGLIVVLAAFVSAAIILAMLPVLQRHALAHPNARSSHRQSTPQGGGIAVIAATIGVVACAIAAGLSEPALYPSSLWLVLAATAFIAVVGAADDLWTIEVAPRLLLQTLAVLVVIASLPAELRVVPMLPWWVERALLLVACVWFVNLTNFMDGIDWMTVAEFVPITIGLALIGWLGALPMQGVIVALALCGGLIGFAPFNWPVARIFLGDVGSLPIGLLFSWQLVLVAGHGHLAAALILPLYYLADATLTLLWRMKNREPFWQAHRAHFYQIATDRGFSVSEIVARVFSVNLALVALAVGSVLWPGRLESAVALTSGAVLVGWLLWSFARGKP
jgi:UDP-N-acetylmuramyl pentapeptide phosphotransferase/UDP-N-acetylglucosamine-1-phosphate transferase